MTSNIISRAACLAELTSNPKSFFNCPDLHGGSGFPEAGSEELATASPSERRTRSREQGVRSVSPNRVAGLRSR